VAHRKGFTLTETLIAIVVVSLLALIGYPRAVNAIATTNVRAARTTVINMIAKARTVATQTNRRSAQIEFTGNKVVVTATPRLVSLAGSSKDTVAPVRDLNAMYGVTVTSTLGVNGVIAFDPRGIGIGLGASSQISLTKSGKTQMFTVDKLGRVIK
jgi:prepilin-type N-terminal cleavage/methylation domain-containing protein